MQITLRTFANLKDIIGSKEITVTLAPKATISDLFDFLHDKYGEPFDRQIKDQLTHKIVPFLILINDETYRSLTDMDKALKHGDVVTVMVPFDGG